MDCEDALNLVQLEVPRPSTSILSLIFPLMWQSNFSLVSSNFLQSWQKIASGLDFQKPFVGFNMAEEKDLTSDFVARSDASRPEKARFARQEVDL